MTATSCRYFEHFEASCCLGPVPVPQAEILPILRLPYDAGSFDDAEEVNVFASLKI